MSRFGQLSLQRVIIDYSAYSTADGLRHAFSRELPQFKKEYPGVVLEVRPRANADTVTAVYRDGSEYSFPVVNLSSQAIYARLHELAQTCNDKAVFFDANNLHHQNRSVQGAWNPYLFLAERNEERLPKPKWDRKLTEAEWAYHVERYSRQMQAERAEHGDALGRLTALPDKMTREVAERWQKYATPSVQTDLEANLGDVKKAAAKGKFPDPVSFEEYSNVFGGVPDVNQGGDDVLRSLRHKEMRKTEQWWDKRKEQLKPPK